MMCVLPVGCLYRPGSKFCVGNEAFSTGIYYIAFLEQCVSRAIAVTSNLHCVNFPSSN